MSLFHDHDVVGQIGELEPTRDHQKSLDGGELAAFPTHLGVEPGDGYLLRLQGAREGGGSPGVLLTIPTG